MKGYAISVFASAEEYTFTPVGYSFRLKSREARDLFPFSKRGSKPPPWDRKRGSKLSPWGVEYFSEIEVFEHIFNFFPFFFAIHETV